MPIYDIEDILADPHFQQRELVSRIPDPDFGEVPMQSPTPRMSGTPLEIRWTGPALGAHTDEVLASWIGMDPDQANDLRQKGII